MSFAGPRIMIKSPPFPVRIDELDCGILSEAIGADVVGFTHRRIGADRGMLGEIFLVDLDYADHGAADGSGRPDTVVVKLAADREESLAVARRARTNERELRCYDELLSTTPVRVPQFYGAWFDADTARFLLVQESIDADTSVDQIEGIGVDRVRAVVDEVAALHAFWWDSDELRSKEWLIRPDNPGRMQNMAGFATNGWEPMCAVLADEMTADERQLGGEFPARLDAALREIGRHPKTLVHSDLRADNLLFSRDGSRATIIDWQGASVGPPAFDLAYLLTQSLTVEDRRQHEQDLLERYRQQLSMCGVELSMEEVLVGYSESMLYCLSIACALQIISDPREPRVRDLTRVIARRSIDALRDLDQLW